LRHHCSQKQQKAPIFTTDMVTTYFCSFLVN
jgi:hypothetical protein